MKKKKVLKTILFIFLILLVLVVILIARKTLIMVVLEARLDKTTNSDNYCVRLYSYQGQNLLVAESYNKNGNYLTTIKQTTPDTEPIKFIYYKNGGNKLALVEANGEKIKYDNSDMELGKIQIASHMFEGIFAKIKYAFSLNIKSGVCNGKECYIIQTKQTDYFIEKSTGLSVRIASKSSTLREDDYVDLIQDYKYEFNTVTNEDITKSDIADYKSF